MNSMPAKIEVLPASSYLAYSLHAERPKFRAGKVSPTKTENKKDAQVEKGRKKWGNARYSRALRSMQNEK